MNWTKIFILPLLLTLAACEYHVDRTRTINGNACTHNQRNMKNVYMVNGKEVPKAEYERLCSEK